MRLSYALVLEALSADDYSPTPKWFIDFPNSREARFPETENLDHKMSSKRKRKEEISVYRARDLVRRTSQNIGPREPAQMARSDEFLSFMRATY